MLYQFPLSALGTGNLSTGAWFITLTRMGVAAAESPGWHHVPSARARDGRVHVQPEIPDINVKKETPTIQVCLVWSWLDGGRWWRWGCGGGVPSGSLQGSRSWCHTLPILIPCCHGGGRISRERLIISAAERSRGRVRAPLHSHSLSLLFWGGGGGGGCQRVSLL